MASAADMLRLVCTRRKKMLPGLDLKKSEYVLLITSNRISRITDFGCRQSGLCLATSLRLVSLPERIVTYTPFDLNWLMYARGSNP